MNLVHGKVNYSFCSFQLDVSLLLSEDDFSRTCYMPERKTKLTLF